MTPPTAALPLVGNRTSARSRLRTAIGLSLSLGALSLGWSLLLRHNLGRTEELMRVVTEQKARNFTLLSADVLEYRDYFARFPRTRWEWTDQTVYVEYYKRAAFGPVSSALTTLLYTGMRVSFPTSMYVILSLYAATASMLVFVLMRRLGLAIVESALLAGIATFSFSWLSLFSVPESYSLSVCATLLAAISGTRLPPLDSPSARVALLRHIVVVGVLSWIYLPVCGAAVLAAARVTHRRQWVTHLAPAAAGAFAIALAPQVVVGLDALQFQVDYARRVSSPAHFDDPTALVGVAAAFAFFGLVAPVSDFIHSRASVDVAAALGSWPTLLVTALLAVAYGALVARAVTRQRLHACIGALLWWAILYGFHVLYNPTEVLLYVSIPTAVLVYLVGLVLAPVERSRSSAVVAERSIVVGSLTLLLIALAMVNAWAVM